MLELDDVKKIIQQHNLGAVIVPSGDEFLSEYVSEGRNRLKAATGFSGSNGWALLGRNHSLLFTDGRYVLQAAQELDMREFAVRDYRERMSIAEEWFAVLEGVLRVGCDPRLHSYRALQALTEEAQKVGVDIVSVNLPCDAVGADSRPLSKLADIKQVQEAYGETKQLPRRAEFPKRSSVDLFLMSDEESGLSIAQKIEYVMSKCDATVSHLFISDPACLSWMMNLRTIGMVPHNPILLGYGVLDLRNHKLYVFVCDGILHGLESPWIVWHNLDALRDFMRCVGGQQSGALIKLDAGITTAYVVGILEECGIKFLDSTDPILIFKACKNPTEIQGMKSAHILDGAAKTKWLHWLHTKGLDGLVNEGGAADMLYEFRRQSSEFLMESFAAISAYGPNAAIVHYHHSAGGGAILGDRDLYLIDSGAHYKCGTTDVTRTVHLGVPSQEQKEWYTLVLKGHIALAQAVFPKGTSGGQLDVLARVPIWSKRADYAHGTGHGVGHVLSVHEGPMAIAPRGVASAVALSPGMVLSNEPGVYYAEAFGIRFESLMVVVEDEREGWLKFEVLTLVPIQMALVAQEMLSAEEMSWIMRYNTRVITEISAGLDRTVLDWLRGYCFQ